MEKSAFTIRIPPDLRERVAKTAAEDKRTVNGQIEWLLEAGLTAREPARIMAEARDRWNAEHPDPKENQR